MDVVFFFFSSRRRHTRYWRDWSSDVCSSDLIQYCDHILKSLPKFEEIAKERKLRLESLNKKKANSLVSTSREIREKINNYIEAIQNNKRVLEQLNKEINEKNHELEELTKKAEERLMTISGRRFSIST